MNRKHAPFMLIVFATLILGLVLYCCQLGAACVRPTILK